MLLPKYRSPAKIIKLLRSGERDKLVCGSCGRLWEYWYQTNPCICETEKTFTSPRKNLLIIKEAKEKYRRDLAIYRLYKYFDYTPYVISQMIGKHEVEVKEIIGKVFRILCVSDRSCVFRKILSEE